jgi:hypothetical protein
MTVLSRHRLPRPYRLLLTIFWALPAVMLFGATVISQGFTPALVDPRLWLLLALLLLPALYVWREGVDVLADGIIARVHVPRYYPYEVLDNWYFDQHPQRRVLTVWSKGRKVLECRAGHLTHLPVLLRALKSHLSWRAFPY